MKGLTVDLSSVNVNVAKRVGVMSKNCGFNITLRKVSADIANCKIKFKSLKRLLV